jgi:glycosyltransferase involved in cell wall biosynthesis
VLGVHCLGRGLSRKFLSDLDVVIVLNNADPETVHRFRPACRPGTRFILWQQHAHDQPYSARLAAPGVRTAWDQFALLSNWQTSEFVSRLGLDPARIGLQRNGFSPAFANLFGTEPILPHKPWPPVLAYTSTPFRGLDRLLLAFPHVRQAIPGTTLKVFSSMAIYDMTHSGDLPMGDDGFGDLYARCRATEGVEYVGSLPQPELAQELRGVTVLAYPNIFPETSCIAVMEALAAGCLVVTSQLGALPETTDGFAWLVPPLADPAQHAELYAKALLRALSCYHLMPQTERLLQAQVHHTNTQMSWDARAQAWETWLMGA